MGEVLVALAGELEGKPSPAVETVNNLEHPATVGELLIVQSADNRDERLVLNPEKHPAGEVGEFRCSQPRLGSKTVGVVHPRWVDRRQDSHQAGQHFVSLLGSHLGDDFLVGWGDVGCYQSVTQLEGPFVVLVTNLELAPDVREIGLGVPGPVLPHNPRRVRCKVGGNAGFWVSGHHCHRTFRDLRRLYRGM